jgi:hypothetical protein
MNVFYGNEIFISGTAMKIIDLSHMITHSKLLQAPQTFKFNGIDNPKAHFVKLNALMDGIIENFKIVNSFWSQEFDFNVPIRRD